ncbi:class I SAM-dependent methyltransferase [Lentzea sp. NBC_00516]|uniref:class I SAM-dependent methyltransferase n=1 Tax=Lentzea sp. NBC_00516 TaxID=2903582 RepID=UPI002E81D9EF|nr:class I SAM-dependent methyltransferase [Lentzea sp. NBC_00516]WUD28041.1 class I SAM-dependent methyltransferase [Lentzea sp. NBC_00516]
MGRSRGAFAGRENGTVLLSQLDRFNRKHPWSHNDYYGPWAARQVAAARAGHVLDVGCGTGNLIARLRSRATTVTGLEPDAATANVAAERFADDPAVSIIRADFAGRDPKRCWDAITLVAVLHHLPLVSSLRELRDCLAPGGRLVIVGCYRDDRTVKLLADLPAILANPVMGMIKHPTRAEKLPPHMTAPTAAAKETLDDIRAAAAQELPGARIQRRLFWRYTLVYDVPSGPDADSTR